MESSPTPADAAKKQLFPESDKSSQATELSKDELLSPFSWDAKTTPKLPHGFCKWEPVCCPRGGCYQRAVQLLLETGAGLWGPYGNLLRWGCGQKWVLPTGMAICTSAKPRPDACDCLCGKVYGHTPCCAPFNFQDMSMTARLGGADCACGNGMWTSRRKIPFLFIREGFYPQCRFCDTLAAAITPADVKVYLKAGKNFGCNCLYGKTSCGKEYLPKQIRFDFNVKAYGCKEYESLGSQNETTVYSRWCCSKTPCCYINTRRSLLWLICSMCPPNMTPLSVQPHFKICLPPDCEACPDRCNCNCGCGCCPGIPEIDGFKCTEDIQNSVYLKAGKVPPFFAQEHFNHPCARSMYGLGPCGEPLKPTCVEYCFFFDKKARETVCGGCIRPDLNSAWKALRKFRACFPAYPTPLPQLRFQYKYGNPLDPDDRACGTEFGFGPSGEPLVPSCVDIIFGYTENTDFDATDTSTWYPYGEPDATPMVSRFLSDHVGRAGKCNLQLKAKTLEINCIYKDPSPTSLYCANVAGLGRSPTGECLCPLGMCFIFEFSKIPMDGDGNKKAAAVPPTTAQATSTTPAPSTEGIQGELRAAQAQINAQILRVQREQDAQQSRGGSGAGRKRRQEQGDESPDTSDSDTSGTSTPEHSRMQQLAEEDEIAVQEQAAMIAQNPAVMQAVTPGFSVATTLKECIVGCAIPGPDDPGWTPLPTSDDGARRRRRRQDEQQRRRQRQMYAARARENEILHLDAAADLSGVIGPACRKGLTKAVGSSQGGDRYLKEIEVTF